MTDIISMLNYKLVLFHCKPRMLWMQSYRKESSRCKPRMLWMQSYRKESSRCRPRMLWMQSYRKESSRCRPRMLWTFYCSKVLRTCIVNKPFQCYSKQASLLDILCTYVRCRPKQVDHWCNFDAYKSIFLIYRPHKFHIVAHTFHLGTNILHLPYKLLSNQSILSY